MAKAREIGGDAAELLTPRRPHDGYSFDELAGSYNFARTGGPGVVFARLVLGEIERIRGEGRPARVLDIGCGRGIARRPVLTDAIGEAAEELWGLEPDASVTAREGLFTHFQHALMEDAELPAGHFDLAYSFMVMEHVEEPVRFLEAVQRVLRPGGVYLFCTPNGLHYFSRAVALLCRLRADERVASAVRRESLEEYHYPVRYRCNRPGQIDRLAAEAGFARSEHAFIEEIGPKPYMRGPLRPVFHLMRLKRQVVHNPRALLTLISRLEK